MSTEPRSTMWFSLVYRLVAFISLVILILSVDNVMPSKVCEDFWGEKPSPQLQGELRRRKLSTTGNKTQLLSRLVSAIDNNNNRNVIDDGRDDGDVHLSIEERQNALRARFSGLKVNELKELLRQKPGALITGKKSTLLDRLVYYETNSDFNVTPSDDTVELVDVLNSPTRDKFKDINANSTLPPFSKDDIVLYLSLFKKSIGPAEGMYQEGFLEVIRYCQQDNFTFIYGICYAEMKKVDKYNVYCKLLSDGEVVGATCECTHGKSSGEAHCKHVSVVLLAVAHVKIEGIVTTDETCTQQLQTFHHPTKKFKGTPLKARQMKGQGGQFGLEPVQESEEEMKNYQTYFRNLILNGGFNSTMPLKHLIEPANPYAIDSDHTYSKFSSRDILLNHLRLKEITTEEIEKIELETQKQSESPLWHNVREVRITASWFYEAIHNEDPVAKAVSKLIRVKATSRAMAHGLKYESVAIARYKRDNPGVDVKCSGLVIMESHPFLGASPDFLVGADGLGEVKCPYTHRNLPIGPQNQDFLVKSKKNPSLLKLKKTHRFYYQVQGHMLVTDKSFCDFVVYTFKDFKVIRIDRKENFISSMLLNLVKFYEDYYRPAIENKYLWRDYHKYSFGK